ncbi:MAG: VOC family protein [Deltaproteobacteria bacterium]|nr:VOC family protein [Deltaproteobacteria bacterium]
MKAKSLSAAFTTNKVEESRDFYVKYFNAKVTFDCGWYVNLEFGNKTSTLQFMSPQQPEHQLSSGAGLIYNFSVENVDEEYEKLTKEGLAVIVPLEDHPWGDRGFAIQDPNGISLYIYSDREPSEEFKQYFK